MADTQRALSAFNDASTGLFKDNANQDISAQDLRDFALSVYGGLQVTTKSATYTATDDDDFIRCTGTWTLTLPAAADRTGKVFRIKNIGAGTITVDGDGAETIDDAANVSMAAQYDSITVVSDGTEWWIIGKVHA